MSGKLIGQVYERQLGHAEQAVLLAMADHADDFGNNCFPSVPYVAWKTGYHERQVQRLIVKLRDLGALVFVRGATRYRPTEYRIDVDALPAKEPFRGDISASPGVTFTRARGDIYASGVTFDALRGDIAMSPEPSYGTEEEDICDAATAAVAAPMLTTQSAHALDVDAPPSTPTSSPWLPLASTMAGDLEGRPSAARTKAGTITAFYGQLVGVFGAKCNDDPAEAAATWRRFVTAMKTQRMKDGRPVWSIIRKSNVLEQAGRWLADDNGQAEGLRPGYAIDPETGRLYVADWSLIP